MFPFFEYLLYNSYAKDIKKGFEMDKLKIAIGSDHGGFRYKGIIEEYLKSKGVEFVEHCHGTDGGHSWPSRRRSTSAAIAT